MILKYYTRIGLLNIKVEGRIEKQKDMAYRKQHEISAIRDSSKHHEMGHWIHHDEYTSKLPGEGSISAESWKPLSGQF